MKLVCVHKHLADTLAIGRASCSGIESQAVMQVEVILSGRQFLWERQIGKMLSSPEVTTVGLRNSHTCSLAHTQSTVVSS